MDPVSPIEKATLPTLRRTDPEFQSLLALLIEVLRKELRLHERVLEAARLRRAMRRSPGQGPLDAALRTEKELILNAALMERDRLSLITELGQILDHPNPPCLRLAELIHHAASEHQDELLDLREDFRDLADAFDDVNAVEPSFAYHRDQNIRLYVTPTRARSVLESCASAPAAKTRSEGPSGVPLAGDSWKKGA